VECLKRKVSMDKDAIEAELEISKTDWHDGRLRSVTYLASDDATSVVLSLEIYEEQQSPERHIMTVKFLGVHEYTQTGVSVELQNNYRAGNIVQARFNTNAAGLLDLGVCLTGGYVRILAESVLVEKAK
jgi:hypothetical protein